MQRSSPDCSAGFSRFDASIEPPDVAPAPMMVWISSMNRTALGFFSSSLTAPPSAAPRSRRDSACRPTARPCRARRSPIPSARRARRPRRSCGRGPRRSRSCRRRARADIERIVLRCAGTAPGWCARPRARGPISRIDPALAGLLVEVDAVGGQRLVALLACGLPPFSSSEPRRPGRRARPARRLGLAVADVVDGVEPGHALVLEERHGVAVALGEQRHQHVGAGHFLCGPTTGHGRRRAGRRAGSPRSAAAQLERCA